MEKLGWIKLKSHQIKMIELKDFEEVKLLVYIPLSKVGKMPQRKKKIIARKPQ